MSKNITDIKAEEILDSRGNPTLKVSVLADEFMGTFDVPSGASTGKYEACELRDGTNSKSGVGNAIHQIENIIKPALIGKDIGEQEQIDKIMIDLDGTLNKTNLGGNSIVGVSIACVKASAKEKGLEVFEYIRSIYTIKESRVVPYLYFNLINGGKHAKSDLAFQEYHIVPETNDIKESIQICKEVQKKLDEIIFNEFGKIFPKGDEGGIALPVVDVISPLSLLKRAVEELDLTDKILFALDVAASSFYDHERGVYVFMDKDWTTSEMIELYKKIHEEYKILSIEDPLDEEDFDGFRQLQDALPDVKIIGDDLTVTNKERLEKAIENKSIKGIIIKPNQIGTLTEVVETIKLARDNNIDCIVSHRSGETMDTFISDLVYAFKCFGIKAGALGPKERDIKYERLVNIINI
jgi:enolase